MIDISMVSACIMCRMLIVLVMGITTLTGTPMMSLRSVMNPFLIGVQRVLVKMLMGALERQVLQLILPS